MSLSTVSVSFVADTAQFIVGLEKIKKSSNLLTKQFSLDSKTMGAALVGATTVVVASFAAMAAGIAAGVGVSISKISELHDEAIKLGISAESFQALGFSAREAGVDMGAFRTAFSHITKLLDQAGDGNEKAISTFNQLGLNFREMQNLSPDQRFAKISQAMGKMTDANQKAVIGAELFGKQYRELRPLLEGGTKAIGENAIAAASLGQLLSDVDVNNIDDAGDSIGRLKETFLGFFNIAAAVMAPFIKSVIDPFIKWLQDGNKLFDAVRIAATLFYVPLRAIALIVDVIIAAFNGLKAVVYGIGTAFLFVAEKSVAGWNEMLKTVSAVYNLITQKMNDLTGSKINPINWNLDSVEEGVSITRKALGDLAVESANAISQNWGKAVGAIDRGFDMVLTKINQVEAGAVAAAANVGKSFEEAVTKSGRVPTLEEILNVWGIPSPAQLSAFITEMKLAKDVAMGMAGNKIDPSYKIKLEQEKLEAINNYRDINGQKVISDELYTANKKKLDKELSDSQLDIWKTNNPLMARANDYMIDFADSMSQAIANGESMSKFFANFFKKMLIDIVAMIVKWMILTMLMTIVGAVNPAAGAAFGKMAGLIQGKAKGGDVSGGTPYIVGEQGPELFVPGNNGYIVPSGDLSTEGGKAIVVNQNIIVNAGVSQTVRAEMAQFMPVIKQQAIQGVMEMSRRGGSFPKAVRGQTT